MVGSSVGAGEDPAAEAIEGEPTIELPRGGTELLPGNLLVGFYGAPQDPALGALGIGTPAEASAGLTKQAAAYEGNRRVVPVLERIATVAKRPRRRRQVQDQQPRSVIDDYLAQAARTGPCVLDVQPGPRASGGGRAVLPTCARPTSGSRSTPSGTCRRGDPGQEIGSEQARVINAIAAQLSEIVAERNLPQKLLIVHRFTEDMVTNPDRLRPHPGVAMVLNVDGFGIPAEKIVKYDDLQAPRGSGLFSGFKLFYSEDTNLMSPNDVLKLEQKPDVVIYE